MRFRYRIAGKKRLTRNIKMDILRLELVIQLGTFFWDVSSDKYMLVGSNKKNCYLSKFVQKKTSKISKKKIVEEIQNLIDEIISQTNNNYWKIKLKSLAHTSCLKKRVESQH